MKRTICKKCNPQRETIIGAETHWFHPKLKIYRTHEQMIKMIFNM